jgi:hypothetical protein
VGEQLHRSPQPQPLAWPWALSFRQSHLQAPPAEDAHLHCFDFIVIGISFFTLSQVALGAPTTEVSHRRPRAGLYEAAVFDERIGYPMGGPGAVAAAEAFSPDAKNGEGISANLPRINTEGAMPTI